MILLVTVTSVVKKVKDIKKFQLMNILRVHSFKSEKELESQTKENIPAFILGQAIPNLALIELGEKPEKVYRPSLLGVKNYELLYGNEVELYFPECVLKETRNYKYALKMSCYESFYRSRKLPEINEVNKETIYNIEIMIERLKLFLKRQKEIIDIAGEFPGAYTDKIKIGEFDILTKNALIDIKVSKNDVTSKDILQIIVYYIMGKKSLQSKKFNELEYLILYNPRLDKIYYVEVKDLNDELISLIEKEIIGYE